MTRNARRAACGHVPMRGAEGHPHRTQLYLQWLLRLPTAPGLPLKGDGDFGMSAFLGSSRTSRCLLVPHDMGCRAQSAMGWRKLSPEHLLRVAQSRIGLAAGRRKRFEFSRAVLGISAEEARVRREGEWMFQLLISLIGAIVPICVEIDQSAQSTAPATRRSVFAPACVCMATRITWPR
jgi:hypothetical protein